MTSLRNGYLWILFSLILLVVDVRQQSYDVLPDVGGYLLMIVGLLLLRRDEAAYGKLIPLAVVLAALAVADIRSNNVWLAKYGDVNYYYNPLFYVEWLRMVLNILLVWRFCAISRRLAVGRLLTPLAESISERAHLYLAAIALAIAAEAAYLAMPQTQFYLTPIIGFCELIAWLLLMESVWQMSRQLGPLPLERKPTSA